MNVLVGCQVRICCPLGNFVSCHLTFQLMVFSGKKLENLFIQLFSSSLYLFLLDLSILMALSLLYTYICYTLLLPFKKLVLVLMLSKAWRNSQSKAVLVIRVARAEKRERNIRINLKALEETSIFFGEQRILINSSFLFEFLPLSGFWIPLFMLLVSSIF